MLDRAGIEQHERRVDARPDIEQGNGQSIFHRVDRRVKLFQSVDGLFGLAGRKHANRQPDGMALVRAKVERWVAMGGAWNFGKCGVDAYMQELLDRWPMDLYVSLEGLDVITGNRRLPEAPVTKFGSTLPPSRSARARVVAVLAQ